MCVCVCVGGGGEFRLWRFSYSLAQWMSRKCLNLAGLKMRIITYYQPYFLAVLMQDALFKIPDHHKLGQPNANNSQPFVRLRCFSPLIHNHIIKEKQANECIDHSVVCVSSV